MTDTHQFYSFAAVIIPVLLFGGAVSTAWKPDTEPANARKRRWLAGLVWVTMMFALAGEIVAINATFTKIPIERERIIVVGAVVVGTVASAGAVAWLWLRELPDGLKGTLIGVGVVAGILGALLMLSTTSVKVDSGSKKPKAESELANIAIAQQQSTTHLAEAATANEKAIRVLAGDLARARADDAALIRAAERR